MNAAWRQEEQDDFARLARMQTITSHRARSTLTMISPVHPKLAFKPVSGQMIRRGQLVCLRGMERAPYSLACFQCHPLPLGDAGPEPNRSANTQPLEAAVDDRSRRLCQGAARLFAES
jgi:hypothetical protein